MRVLIVDDEPLARRGVCSRLAKYPDFEIVGECAGGVEAVAAIRTLSPDLVFLDIQMPDLNGFDVLRRLQENAIPPVIFLTAYDQYALKAFEIHALDYLLKPVDDERFAGALEHARAHIRAHSAPVLEQRIRKLLAENAGATSNSPYETHFAVRTGQRIVIVAVEEIDWIQASGDYVTLHAGNKAHLLRETMNRMESQLDPERFLRIHRSAMVQTSRIRELVTLDNREFLVRLTTGTELKASRTYSDRIERWL